MDEITFKATIVIKGNDPVNIVRMVEWCAKRGIGFAVPFDFLHAEETLPVLTIDLEKKETT